MSSCESYVPREYIYIHAVVVSRSETASGTAAYGDYSSAAALATWHGYCLCRKWFYFREISRWVLHSLEVYQWVLTSILQTVFITVSPSISCWSRCIHWSFRLWNYSQCAFEVSRSRCGKPGFLFDCDVHFKRIFLLDNFVFLPNISLSRWTPHIFAFSSSPSFPCSAQVTLNGISSKKIFHPV